MFVEYLMERRSRLEDTSKQSGWGNSPPNPTDGKLMHIYFYRNYIFLKSDIHFNKCVMCLLSTLLFSCKRLYLGVRAQQTLS